MYQNKLQRLGRKSEDTPRSKYRKLHRKLTRSKKTVRKTLVFHYSLIEQIKQNHKHRKTYVKHLIAGEILRKYHFKSETTNLLWCSPYNYKKRKGCLSVRLRASVHKFFEMDDISRMMSGKQSTITRRKIKKQKRVLCDFLYNLYWKYRVESVESIRFVTFWRLKPFWVTYPRQGDTCLCKKCENTHYMQRVSIT